MQLQRKLFWNVKKDKLEFGIKNQVAYDLIKVFNQVADLMYNREILPGESGVVYSTGNTTVLWAFESFEYSNVKMKSVINVLNNSLVDLNKNGSFKASELTVYQINCT